MQDFIRDQHPNIGSENAEPEVGHFPEALCRLFADSFCSRRSLNDPFKCLVYVAHYVVPVLRCSLIVFSQMVDFAKYADGER